MALNLRIGSIRDRTRSEGPGIRFAVWLQGCSLRCAGCFNPHFWNPNLGTVVSVDALLLQIKGSIQRHPEIEGVTFLGGEPFEQSISLAALAAEIRTQGLSVMTFTGYRLDELEDTSHSDYFSRQELLRQTDLLVDGRYESDKIDKIRPWVGSTNQNFHFLSERYCPESLFINAKDSIEINVSPQGIAKINGWATSDSLEKLLENL
jgi:anaerobic ribonucleoside-triphosphate reductase activating protein